MKAGKFKSVRAAAKAAGIVKDTTPNPFAFTDTLEAAPGQLWAKFSGFGPACDKVAEKAHFVLRERVDCLGTPRLAHFGFLFSTQ